MTPIDVLNAHYVGKKIVKFDALPNYVGWEILNVKLADYEPIYEFAIKNEDEVKVVDVLDEWTIEVK